MYIPRPILILLVIFYLMFLLSVDWINQNSVHWYRPFGIGFFIIGIAAWTHREQDSDEL